MRWMATNQKYFWRMSCLICPYIPNFHMSQGGILTYNGLESTPSRPSTKKHSPCFDRGRLTFVG